MRGQRECGRAACISQRPDNGECNIVHSCCARKDSLNRCSVCAAELCECRHLPLRDGSGAACVCSGVLGLAGSKSRAHISDSGDGPSPRADDAAKCVCSCRASISFSHGSTPGPCFRSAGAEEWPIVLASATSFCREFYRHHVSHAISPALSSHGARRGSSSAIILVPSYGCARPTGSQFRKQNTDAFRFFAGDSKCSASLRSFSWVPQGTRCTAAVCGGTRPPASRHAIPRKSTAGASASAAA
mmetsp:Transcript_96607/g.245619  ORF Transcript_96607/g.245619 Transcript_96607/m.245619 type:complete len:244 (+) Transcript_96607:1351-2082(+)